MLHLHNKSWRPLVRLHPIYYLCDMKMKRILLFAVLLVVTAMTSLADSRVEYYNLMGDADKAINEGRWADAEDFLRKAMRLEPSNPSNVLLMSNLGMVQFYDGRADEAVATLSDAHAIAPASVVVLMNRARVLTSMGLPERAVSDYNRVIALDSTLAEPRFYRAMINLRAGNTDKATADIDTLRAKMPDNRFTHVAEATLFLRSGHFSEAIPHLSAILREQPDADYYGQRALCYLATNDPAAAADDIAKGLELDPTDGELYLYRAMLNKMRYRPEDAHADGEKAIRFGVDSQRVKAVIGQ